MSGQLLFGRFLAFSTTVLKPESLPKNLNERRFRNLWASTDQAEGNERIRFQQLLKLIESNLVVSLDHGRNLNLAPAIMQKYADGQWYWLDDIVTGLDAPRDDIVHTLEGAFQRPPEPPDRLALDLPDTPRRRLISRSSNVTSSGSIPDRPVQHPDHFPAARRLVVERVNRPHLAKALSLPAFRQSRPHMLQR